MKMQEVGKPFTSGYDQRRNGNGRPKKLVTIISGYGLTPSQTTDIINEMMLLTEGELKLICDNEEATIFETTIAMALIKSKNKGSLYALETILNRGHGLPKMINDINLRQEKYEITLNLT